MQKKILLLGSGELGKEFAIASHRYGQYVVAVDNYANAPAMQVAHEYRVIDMLDGAALDAVVEEVAPDIIVPEIEAIRTTRLYAYEERGIRVVPSAKAVNYTMNRKAIRDLAAGELGLRTAPYQYATSAEELLAAATTIGFPCVVKPLMSSSGKGQSVLYRPDDVQTAWRAATEKGRGDEAEVIVEGFIDFTEEITLLTITQHQGPTRFCPPIGHRQERGDYQESWQPATLSGQHLNEAQEMAAKITHALTGAGIWGVEFFIAPEGVYFSELSPRPHDTGMVTLAGTQVWNEFELHLRAILGYPVPDITLQKMGASAVVLADKATEHPTFAGTEEAAAIPQADFRLFGKPTAHLYRRMGVGLAYGDTGMDMTDIRQRAQQVAGTLKLKS